jgi:hypothetical protein
MTLFLPREGNKIWPKVRTGSLSARKYLAPSRSRRFGCGFPTDGSTARPSRARACLHAMNFPSPWFLSPMHRRPTRRRSHERTRRLIRSGSLVARNPWSARRRRHLPRMLALSSPANAPAVVRLLRLSLRHRRHAAAFVRAAGAPRQRLRRRGISGRNAVPDRARARRRTPDLAGGEA